MRSKKFAGAAGACALVAVPAVALAASHAKPKDGKFTGTAHYKVSGKSESGSITVTVAKGKIKEIQIIASVLPLDAKHSHGFACGAANEMDSKGHKSSGTVSHSGQFNYTFKSNSKTSSDKMTLVGQFTSAKTLKATFRDVDNIKVAKSVCDTGKVKFTAAN